MHTHSPSLPAHSSTDVRESLRSVLTSALLYLEARLRIVRLEGREALRAGAWVAVLGATIILSLITAYVGFMLAFAWWLFQSWGDGSAVPAVVVFTLAHLALALAAALGLAHAVRRGDFFHATRKEFKEDRRWLEAHQTFKN